MKAKLIKPNKIKELEKKQAKKERKIHSIVKRVGQYDTIQSDIQLKNNKRKNNELVEAITRSVILNKKMMNNDKDVLKKWQESYFQELYSEFKNLVEKYNNGLQVKAEELTDKISDLKIKKRILKDEVRELEAKKKTLINE